MNRRQWAVCWAVLGVLGGAQGVALSEESQKSAAGEFRLTSIEHFVLGNLSVTGRAGRTNTASSADPESASNVPVEIEETNVKEVKVGYDKKPLLRDLYWMVRSPWHYKLPPRQSAVDDLVLEAFKLEATVAFGDSLKLKNGKVASDKIATDDADRTTYGVFLSYEVPLENLWGHIRYRQSTGSWGYRDKEGWWGARD